MKIPVRCVIETAASDDDTRHSIAAAYLDLSDKEHPAVHATDGRVLVSVAVEVEDGDTAGSIPKAALKMARRGTKRGLPARIRLGENDAEFVGEAGARVAVVRNPPGGAVTFPDVGAVYAGVGKKPERHPDAVLVRIGFNPLMLMKILRAIWAPKPGDEPCVELRFCVDPKTGAALNDPFDVRVHGAPAPEHRAALMPMRLPGDRE